MCRFSAIVLLLCACSHPPGTPPGGTNDGDPAMTTSADLPAHELQGTWSPLPGTWVPDLAATRDQLVLVEARGQHSDDVSTLTVRPGRWTGHAWSWGPTWRTDLPNTVEDGSWPQMLSLHPTPNALDVALNLEEFQGGSRGIAIAELTASGWSQPHRIANSMDDADIRFGAPLVLTGDELFTVSVGPEILQYRRAGGWTATTLPLPDVIDEPWWTAALDRTGTTLLVDYMDKASHVKLAEYTRGRGDAFTLRSTMMLGTQVTAAGFAFVGDDLLTATEVNTGLELQRHVRDPNGAWKPVEVRVLPLAGNDKWGFSTRLAVTDDWIFAGGWVYRTHDPAARYWIAAPPRPDGRPLRAKAVLMGDSVVVIAGDRIGRFDLERLQ